MSKLQGADSPASIMIGRRTLASIVKVSYPYPMTGP
jgi:hypothetical protein